MGTYSQSLIEHHISAMMLTQRINSGYGALANKFFRWYNLFFAEAITSSGQLTTKWIEKKLNERLNKMFNTDKDWVIAIDTDSVVGDTVINVNGKPITIEDFYDNCNGEFLKKDDFNEQYVKKVSNSITPSVDSLGNLNCNNIKYVMKHKVQKRMYKITSRGKAVIVTEDHSVIVRIKKTGEITSIKPKNLRNNLHEVINIVAVDTDT